MEALFEVPRCHLCDGMLLPHDMIVRHIHDEDHPFAHFAKKNILRAHPRCIIKHHEMLQNTQEEWA